MKPLPLLVARLAAPLLAEAPPRVALADLSLLLGCWQGTGFGKAVTKKPNNAGGVIERMKRPAQRTGSRLRSRSASTTRLTMTTRNLNGGARIAKVLYDRGIREIFELCGGHISPILVEAKKAGIRITDVRDRITDVRDEATAVFAAAAHAPLTGIPGVAAVTAGSGLTNTITAVKNAQLAQPPIPAPAGSRWPRDCRVLRPTAPPGWPSCANATTRARPTSTTRPRAAAPASIR